MSHKIETEIRKAEEHSRLVSAALASIMASKGVNPIFADAVMSSYEQSKKLRESIDALPVTEKGGEA